MIGKSHGPGRIISFLCLLAIAQFALPSMASEKQGPGSLQQPLALGNSLLLQDPPPNEKKDQEKKDQEATKSPSNVETSAEKKARIRRELLERMQKNRLAGTRPMWGDFMGIAPSAELVIGGPPPLPGGSGFPLSEGGSIAIRRLKLSENNSPLPMDRWFFGHNFFNDVRNVGDVNRYVFGLEKTYDDGLGSLEIRFPFSSRPADTQSLGLSLGRNTEAGDLSLIWKRVVAARGDILTTAGLGVRLPTAGDGRVLQNDTELFRIEHKSLHLAPFVAMLGVEPEKKIFWQVFLQVDVPANGNPLTTQATGGGTTLGVLQDATLLFADASIGYNWIEEREGLVKSVTPMLELHYTSTLNETDDIPQFEAGGLFFQVRDEALRYNILNLTAALDLKISDRISIRPAMSFPLRAGTDRLYDFEAGIQLNLLR